MSIKHNRIKVADLEKNQSNKTLITNDNGELEFIDANLKADINSPIFTGTPESPTPTTENGIVNKSYADGLIAGLLNDRGSYNASTNLFPATGGSGTSGSIKKGDLWYVSVAGTLGTKAVNIGDSFRALVNTPGQTAANWSILEANIGYIPANDAETIHKSGNEIFTGIKSVINTGITLINGIQLINNGTTGSNVFSLSNSSTGIGGILNNGGGGVLLSGNNGGSGSFFIINSGSTSTGDLLQFKKNNVITSYFDQNGILNTITAPVGTNTIQAATTAFVLANSVQGNGTMDYISKWSSTTGRLINSRISDNGTIISIPSFAPPTTNTENIGTSSLYYNQAFVQTGYINNVNANATKTNSLTVGMINTSGRINFVRALDGDIQAGIGYVSSNNSSEVRLSSNGGGAFITFHTAGGEGFRLSSNKNLLIGTQTDTTLFKFDVNGNVRMSGTVNTQSIIPTTNNIYTLGNSVNTWNELFVLTSSVNNIKSRSGAGINFLAGNGTMHGRMFDSGNWAFLSNGNYIDAGYKFDIDGTTRLNGAITIADPLTSAGTYDILTKNASNVIEKIPSSIFDNFVHKTGEVTEIIDGFKIFRSPIEINGEDEEVSTSVSSGGIIYYENGYPSLRLAPNHLGGGEGTNSLVEIPRKSGTLVMSVNGELADESGNVVIAGGSQDLLQTLINGSTATGVSNFVVSGSNGSVSLTGNGAEISNNQYGQLEISPNGVVLQNRGNTNPLSINGNNSGVNINGSYGQSLKMTSTGPAQFRSTQGILIQNMSNEPLDVYSTVQTTVQGVTGLDLLSQQGAVNIVGPAGVNLSAIGGVNQLKMVNESYKIQLLSQAGGIDINSSGGPITIKNTSGAGVSIGDSSVSSPITFSTAGTMELNAANLMLSGGDLIYIGNDASGNYIVFQNDGSIDLAANSNQNIRIDGNVMSVRARRTDFASPIVLPTTTVASLPTSPIGGYQYATVSDATSPNYLQPVVGGGTVVCPVFYNGTSWVAH